MNLPRSFSPGATSGSVCLGRSANTCAPVVVGGTTTPQTPGTTTTVRPDWRDPCPENTRLSGEGHSALPLRTSSAPTDCYPALRSSPLERRSISRKETFTTPNPSQPHGAWRGACPAFPEGERSSPSQPRGLHSSKAPAKRPGKRRDTPRLHLRDPSSPDASFYTPRTTTSACTSG